MVVFWSLRSTGAEVESLSSTENGIHPRLKSPWAKSEIRSSSSISAGGDRRRQQNKSCRFWMRFSQLSREGDATSPSKNRLEIDVLRSGIKSGVEVLTVSAAEAAETKAPSAGLAHERRASWAFHASQRSTLARTRHQSPKTQTCCRFSAK